MTNLLRRNVALAPLVLRAHTSLLLNLYLSNKMALISTMNTQEHWPETHPEASSTVVFMSLEVQECKSSAPLVDL